MKFAATPHSSACFNPVIFRRSRGLRLARTFDHPVGGGFQMPFLISKLPQSG